MEALEDLLLRVVLLSAEVTELAELDLNPVIATPSGAVVVDAKLRIAPGPPESATTRHLAPPRPLPAEDDLECAGLGRPGEHVVGVDELVEREVVGDEPCRVELAARTSRSSVGVEYVSTRPVVIVTSLIQRSSRCSVAGSPWTPMLATWPPGRMSWVASSKVAGTPTASIATSAPRPPVRLIDRGDAHPRDRC